MDVPVTLRARAGKTRLYLRVLEERKQRVIKSIKRTEHHDLEDFGQTHMMQETRQHRCR
jgi:hypothetical protein